MSMTWRAISGWPSEEDPRNRPLHVKHSALAAALNLTGPPPPLLLTAAALRELPTERGGRLMRLRLEAAPDTRVLSLLVAYRYICAHLPYPPP